MPTLRWIGVFGALAPAWIFVALTGSVPVAVGAALLVALWVGVGCADWLRLPRAAAFEVRRTRSPRVALRDTLQLELELVSTHPQPLQVQLRETLPAGLELVEAPSSALLAPEGKLAFTTKVKATTRGVWPLGPIHLALRAPAGWAERRVQISSEASGLAVYPRFRQLEAIELKAALTDDGERKRRRAARALGGTEFESLRPYVRGDPPRHIDWKATARRGELVVRNYQVERGQHLAVVVDCGRSMREPIEGQARLEHALEAAVVLGRLAERRGDSVSVTAFSNRIERELPPTKGPETTPKLLETLLGVPLREVESDYFHVFGRVIGSLKKRSLIAVMTNLSDIDSSRGLVENLIRAAHRHVILCVVLTDPKLLAQAEEKDTPTSVRAASSLTLLDRLETLERLRARGGHVIAATPEDLGLSLLERYTELRSREFA